MARNAGFSIENNFSNGLVTEATGLSFPENAVVETDNITYSAKGEVSRRKGIDLEVGGTYNDFGLNSRAYVEYLWESVASDGNITFLVEQVGGSICIYRVTNDPAVSDNLLFTLPFGVTYGLGTSDQISENFCQFSIGLGHLVVAHPYCKTFYVTYDKDTNSFDSFEIEIFTRDLIGLEPRPIGRLSTLSETHHYNLYNQGWDENKIVGFRQKGGVYPSDYDVWWLYKTPDAFGTEVFLTDVAVAAGILQQIDRGNSPAPRGSRILNEFYQDRGAATQFSNSLSLPVVTSGIHRPSCTEFHAGRIFYAGVNLQDFGQKIYFSQILESETQFGKCHQENDPTSQFSSDLLPTDGGVISIPEAGTVYRLWSVDNSLLVFASQGVWQITGSQGIGFSATDYTVKKISTAATLSGLSFVKVDGRPVWWSQDDIYVAMADTQIGGLSVQSLTNDRIKTFFQEIPEESKRYAKGAYNNRDRVVQWVYRHEVSTSVADRQDYTKILNLNTDSKAFYPWSIENPLVKIRGISVIKGSVSSVDQVNVFDNLGALVTDSLLSNVFVEAQVQNTVSAIFKYTIFKTGSGTSFAQTDETTYTNWSSIVGGPISSPGYFVSGYRVRGDALKKFQSNYIRVFVENLEPQEFLLSCQWDYANNINSLRWSVPQRVVFNNPNLTYESRRLKLRGHGLACQFRVETVGDEGLNIIGWSVFETANTGV